MNDEIRKKLQELDELPEETGEEKQESTDDDRRIKKIPKRNNSSEDSGYGLLKIIAAILGIIIILIALFYSVPIAVVMLLLAIIAPWALYNVASNIGIFYFLIPEAHAIIIELNGAFHKVLFRYKGRVMGEDGFIREAGPEDELPAQPFGGFVWIGIYPFFRLAEYTLRWKTMRPNGEILYRQERMKVFLLADDVYVIQMLGPQQTGNVKTPDERPETKEKIPLELTFLMTGAIVSPQLFKYGSQDSYEMITNRIKQLMKEYVGNKSFEELVMAKQESKDIVGVTFRPEVRKEMKKLPHETKEEGKSLIEIFRVRYGFKVTAVEPYSITPEAKYVEPSTAKYLAERSREKTVIDAMGSAQKTLIEAAAEKTRIVKVVSTWLEFGQAGLFIRDREAQEKIAASGKATHYFAPTGAVDAVSRIMTGSGLSERQIVEIQEKIKKSGIKPEEMDEALDIIALVQSDPQMKTLWDGLTKKDKGVQDVQPKS